MRRLDLLPSAPYYPTASELHRAAECVATWALGLPEAEEAPGEWAEFGRRMHAIAEGIGVRRGDGIPDFLSERDEHIAMFIQHAIHIDDVDSRPANSAWLVEQGVSWRPGFPDDEAELISRAPGERRQGWFSGTVDLAYVRADGVLVVADWKFGELTRWIGEKAEAHTQLWTLAVAFTTALRIRGSSENVVVARVEARHVSEEGITVDGHDLTQGQIDAWALSLRGLARRIDTATDAAPKLSAACGRCKAKEACPTWTALESNVFAHVAGSSIEALCRPPTSPEDVRALYHAFDALDTADKNWTEWVKAWVLTHPEGVEIGLGLSLKARERASRAVLQTAEALAVIEAVAGPGAIVVKRKSSLGQIEKVVKEAAGNGIASASDRAKAKKAAVETAFARLVSEGAIHEKGAKFGVAVVRSDGESTAWKGGEDE